MGKGAGDQINKANSIADTQISAGTDAGNRSSTDYNTFRSLMQPLVNRDTALATGSRRDALAAAMPVISKLTEGFSGAKASIMNSMPAGAARDRALGDLETQSATGIAGAQAGLVRDAPTNLATAGSKFGDMSLQELGAMFSGMSGAAQTNAGAMQAKVQERQAMLNFFGQLAGAAGGMIDPIKIH